MDIEILIEDEDDEGENNSQEMEEEEDENSVEPFIEENATESENLSLDDMIEELEYGEEEDDESESDDGQDDDNSEIIEEADQVMEVEDVNSEEADEIEDDLNELEMELADQDDDLESPADEHDHEPIDGFNVIEIDDPGELMDNMREFRANMGYEDMDIEEDEEDVIEGEGDDLGFNQLMNILHRRGHDRPPMFFRGNNREGGVFRQAPNRARRDPAEVRNLGLDSIYQVVNQAQSNSDVDFWENNMNVNVPAVNRNNNNRPVRSVEDPFGGEFGNLLARDLQRLREDLDDIRDRIGDRNFGNRRNREEVKEAIRTMTNPFEVLR
jgi:hypothetical protein